MPKPERIHLEIKDKLAAVKYARDIQNVKEAASEWRVQPKQIRYWRAQELELLQKLIENSNAKTVHKGVSAAHPELEIEVYEWFNQMRNDGFPVTTPDIITKARVYYPNFKEGSMGALIAWARAFRQRHDLVFRRPTRVAQSTPEESEAIRVEFAQTTMTNIKAQQVPPAMFVNMDETAIYFEPKITVTVNKRGKKTIHVRRGTSSHQRLTLCVSIAHDGTKIAFICNF